MRRNRREGGAPLTLVLIERIERALFEHRWTHAILAQRSGVDARTIQTWLDHNARTRAAIGRPMKPRLLPHVAEALGINLLEVTSGDSGSRPSTEIAFPRMLEIAEQVDKELVDVTRRLIDEPIESVRTAYRRVLNDSLRDFGLSLTQWTQLLEDADGRRHLRESAPGVSVTVDVAPNFEAISFRLLDGRVVEVQSPELLWDCACETPGGQSPISECPIHSVPGGNAVDRAFRKQMTEIRWRGLTFRWRSAASLWPPSIDSFAIVMDLEAGNCFSNNTQRSVLDLGSGTGFLGIAAACMSRSISRVILADWLLTPSVFGALNWDMNGLAGADLTVRVGLFTDWLPEGGREPAADLAICNPPYLPLLPGFDRFATHSVVAGTELLSHLIRCSPAIGRRVFVGFSTLASTQAFAAAADAGKRLTPLKPDGRYVPFRVQRAWTEVPEYFLALQQIPGALAHEPDRRHPYWHTIHTYEIEDAAHPTG